MVLDLNKSYTNPNLEYLKMITIKRNEIKRMERIIKVIHSFGYKQNEDYYIQQSC